MRFMSFAAACAVALLSVVAAGAEEAQQVPAAEGQTAAPAGQVPEAGQPTPPAEDPNEVICKRLEADTGTRLGKRKECRTRKEWAQIAEEAKQNLEKSQSKN